jgi:hypothetical protein
MQRDKANDNQLAHGSRACPEIYALMKNAGRAGPTPCVLAQNGRIACRFSESPKLGLKKIATKFRTVVNPRLEEHTEGSLRGYRQNADSEQPDQDALTWELRKP